MIKLKQNNIKVVFSDIDGVWTDGGMYYSEKGEALKKFNTSDSAGVLFLRRLQVPLVILTGEDAPSVKKRMEKLKIEHAFHGVKNKLETARAFCNEHQIDLATEAAFIGNDFNDWPLLEKVAHSAVPTDAPLYIQKNVNLVLTKKGGEGAFREYIEYLIGQERDLEAFVKGM